MTFNQLRCGKLYGDADGVVTLVFRRMRNESLAEFRACEYEESKGDYVVTGEAVYLTSAEVKRLREW